MKTENFLTNNSPHTLIIILHGISNAAKDLLPVENTIIKAWPSAKICRPKMHTSSFSMKDPNTIVATLLSHIDDEVEQARQRGHPYDNIILVGHSFGGLIVRKLYVVACGEVLRAPLEEQYKKPGKTSSASIPPREWAAKISRIILLAGMNRGWRISHHISLLQAISWQLLTVFCNLTHLLTRRWPLVITIRRGAQFITQLRIQWLLMRRRAGTPQDCAHPDSPNWPGNAVTVQLLGSRDDMVAPEDNVDLVSGGDFIYLDVPYSGHVNIIEMDDCVFGPERARVFLFALRGSVAQLKQEAVVPSDENFATPDEEIKRVVFVIHGIRDLGHWTHQIARRIKKRSGQHLSEWATETSSYGYFPMLPFISPWYRRLKVEWLMDQYAEALARYPNATFSYVGHSNGTYLLAKALELYPCCAFENIVFAGSVVRKSFDWSRFLKSSPPKAGAILNFVATSDWIVAVFPKFFQQLKLQDLGSAGHDGFILNEQLPNVYQIRYIHGGHGAAIQEPIWDVIADFIVSGTVDAGKIPDTTAKNSPAVKLLGNFSYIAWLLILAAIWGIWLGIKALIAYFVPDMNCRSFATGFALAAYLVLLWLALTRI